MEEFCKKLPKLELHAHLNGSLSERTLKHLGCQSDAIEEYQKLNKIFCKTEKTLKDCFELFKLAHNATNNIESVYYATRSVIEDFSDDNVIYLELRTTPRSEAGMTKEEYVESVVKAIKDNESKLIVKLLLSLDRRHEQSISEESLDLIIKMKQKYPNIIKGVDLSGNPAVGKFESRLFEKARESGLKTAIHCAEIENDSEVREMLEFKPDRLGHGTYLHPDYGGSLDNWNLYKNLRIPTECCLTSNVVCGTSKSYKEHHVQEWIKNSLPFCINTDDKGVFCSALSQEYFIVAKTFNLTTNELWKISYNTIDYIFCDDKEKTVLREILLEWRKENSTQYF